MINDENIEYLKNKMSTQEQREIVHYLCSNIDLLERACNRYEERIKEQYERYEELLKKLDLAQRNERPRDYDPCEFCIWRPQFEKIIERK